MTYSSTLRVVYPLAGGRMVLRTDADWEADIEPRAVSADGTASEFLLASDRSFSISSPASWIRTACTGRWGTITSRSSTAGRRRSIRISSPARAAGCPTRSASHRRLCRGPAERLHGAGYYAYGRFLAEELKPAVDRNLRTLADAANTAVMGSSLGGVVSFHLAWQRPELFGKAACMSSTFTFKDDLLARVAGEPKKPVVLYLDSGWRATTTR